MSDIKTTENEFRGQVISWLNEFIKDGSYPFEVASSDPSIKVSEKKTQFPDVQIWLNRKAHQGFCGWELKTPSTSVYDYERYLKELQAKLFEVFFSRTHDHKQADTLVQQVFEEMELPII